MKVLFFINCLAAGGKERRLVELMKGLKAYPAIDFELVIMNREVHYKEVFALDIKIHFLIRKSKKDVSIFWKLYQLCKKIKPDIIHCWDSMTAIYAAPVCKLLHIKLANGMVVGAPDKRGFLKGVYTRSKLTFPASDVIIGNSQAGLSAYQAPLGKSVCIYNGFNFDRLNELKSAQVLREELGIKTDYTVGMVASFSENKDYKTFFEAAQVLLGRRNNVTFLAIGLNTDSVNAKRMIQDRYKEHFKFLGKRSDVESLINLMDITVLATFTEGISNAILEYMALGKPVIATEGGGTNEIVMDGVTGFLVKRSDIWGLSDKMNVLLNDNSLCSKLGNAGKERIQEHFYINKMIDKYVSVYKNLCKN